jgi:hypothetical protein
LGLNSQEESSLNAQEFIAKLIEMGGKDNFLLRAHSSILILHFLLNLFIITLFVKLLNEKIGYSGS